MTATGRPDQALELLAYSHYETAERIARGHCEVARAFALHRLKRSDESLRAIAAAVRLNPDNAQILKVLGFDAFGRENHKPEAAVAAQLT
jgi:hypothetical protein